MMKFLLILFCLIGLNCAHQFFEDEPTELIFTSCILPRWACVNESNELSSYVSKVTYTCETSSITKERTVYDYNNVRETYIVVEPVESITLDLSNWTKWTLAALKIEDCKVVNLRMHTNFESNIDKLTLSDVETLYIQPPKTNKHNHHPRNIIFQNVKLIAELPPRALADNNTEQVVLQNVVIGKINQGAINLHGPVKTFTLQNATVRSIQRKSISVTMEQNSKFLISSSNFSVLQFDSISITNGSTIIRNSTFSILQEGSIIVTDADFFRLIDNNFIINFKNAFMVDAPRIIIKGNEFLSVNDAVQMVYIMTENGAYPDEKTFYFMENIVKSEGSALSSCTSKSTAYVNTGNCTTQTSIAEYYATKNKPTDVMLFNLLVCDNNFDIEIPSDWFPKTKPCIQQDSA